jgi:hypothetical protein
LSVPKALEAIRRERALRGDLNVPVSHKDRESSNLGGPYLRPVSREFAETFGGFDA